MALTKKQLDEIMAIIDRHMLTFMADVVGDRAMTPDEIQKMKDFGLLKENVKHMIIDPVQYGRVVALLPEDIRKKLSKADIEKMIRKLKPTTDTERAAMEYATNNVGEHIRGLKDSMVKDVRTVVAGQALQEVRQSVVAAIEDRQTPSELKTILFDKFDDRNRDWRRVASTEMNDAIQFGIAAEIKRTSDEGADQLVYKRPNPDACSNCNRLYLDSGIPRIFKLSEMAVSNVGRKAADWLPTVGSVHPWCACQLHVLPEGFGFKKKNVVAQRFEDGGKIFNIGQEISDSEIANLSAENKTKIRQEPILEFIGWES